MLQHLIHDKFYRNSRSSVVQWFTIFWPYMKEKGYKPVSWKNAHYIIWSAFQLHRNLRKSYNQWLWAELQYDQFCRKLFVIAKKSQKYKVCTLNKLILVKYRTKQIYIDWQNLINSSLYYSKNSQTTRLRLVVYKFFSCSTNIPRGLSAYKP